MRRGDVPLEPLTVRSKGRPKGSLNLAGHSRSTRRDPSLFEHVEQAERTEAAKNSAIPPKMKKRGLDFIEEYGDGYEPVTQMQRSYQRAARQTPVSDNETCEGPVHVNLISDSSDERTEEPSVPPSADPPVNLSVELSVHLSKSLQDVSDDVVVMDEWDKMDAQWNEEENALATLKDRGLLDNV